MKYLVHAGPWSDMYLTEIVKHISSDNDSLVLSGHKSVDKSGMCSGYYKSLEENSARKMSYEPDLVDTDIIKRCRLLRALDLQEALLHLNSMRSAIREVMDVYKPDIILTETIDSYIMDILYFEAKERNIEFVGLVTVFLNGYFRVSARGEFNKSRSPSDLEVLETLNTLEKKDYLPSFVVKDRKKPVYAILRKWARNLIKLPYFFFKRRISGDFYNYHYWQGVISSRESSHLWPKFNLGEENWEEQLKKAEGKVVYIPLQMFPEATVDYWCQSADVIDYDNVLCDFIRKHYYLHFLIKEHPNVVGYRNPSLYKRLSKFSNVTICPTQVNSNSIFNLYDAVLVWTGTVGFESALRGKPVFCLADPYYFPDGEYYKKISPDSTRKEIESYIESQNRGLSDESKIRLVEHLLSGVLKGRLVVDGTWDQNSSHDVELMEELAGSLREYVDSLNLPLE